MKFSMADEKILSSQSHGADSNNDGGVVLLLLYKESTFAGNVHQVNGGFKTTMNVEHEIGLLVEEIRRLGTKNADGQVSVKFGVLFADEKCANLFEALVGTLKAAKRRKIVTYQGELLLQGVHDNVDIMLLQN
ncbi:Costars family protein ABRACL [Pitangus sulphuratus]|nr:Costars family protein ABRACL [Pitangus sulphuratus]